jgi:rhodanese-related sulfurtransferase
MNDMEHMIWVILKMVLSGMAFCGFLSITLPAAGLAPFADITPSQAADLIREKGQDPLFIILDVRTAMEFSTSRIKGARNIDAKAPAFRESIGKLDKNGAYLVYCRSGKRSAMAMSLMKELGFKEVYNLAGGILKWQAEKLPLEASNT